MRFSLHRSRSATNPSKGTKHEFKSNLRQFEQQNPDYNATPALTSLRTTEFGRLKSSNTTYVDYMGGGLYPDSLVSYHCQMLKTQVFGNTHSDSPTSRLSESHIKAARTVVLDFFDASPEDYVCVFTSNATGALKIVGESYPFSPQSSYVLSSDSHNSVNGIRRFAHVAGAEVRYLAACPQGGFDEAEMKSVLASRQPESSSTHCLFAVTGQSNVTGHRPALHWVTQFAKQQGFDLLLDAAALAPSSRISLRQLNGGVDAMAISFYKMFGYPTGVGALVARKDFLAKLRKPYFAGGTVEFVQVPGIAVRESEWLYERFEEGTLNYANLPTIAYGLQFLSKYIDSLAGRLSALHHYLHESLVSLRYSNGAPLIQIHTANSREGLHQPSRRTYLTPPATPRTSPSSGHKPTLTTHPEHESEGSNGYVVSSTFLSPTGDPLPLSFVSHHAAKANISLRTGCVCNPGGAMALLGKQEEMTRIEEIMANEGWKDWYGVVRMSLGLGSDFEDVWKVVQWAKGLTEDGSVDRALVAWKQKSSDIGARQAKSRD